MLEKVERLAAVLSFRGDNCSEDRTKIFVCCKSVDRACSIMLVDLVEPCNTSCGVLWPGLPMLTGCKRQVSQSSKASSQ